MLPLIVDHLSKLELGELQECDGMAVIPLFFSDKNPPDYLTFKEGLEKDLLQVTEVDQGGSVPELKVINNAPTPVLGVDGEELIGAKQNRVLNTSVLLKEKSETIIPVSCTEHGRWSYVSREFAHSDVLMASNLRAYKVSSVSKSLKGSLGHQSNQSEIWDKIKGLSLRLDVNSPTGAMRDIFVSKNNDLKKYAQAFECSRSQKGLLVFVNGEVAGLDFVSRESAYQVLHSKLVRSYALQALSDDKQKKRKPSMKKAKAFLREISECSESKFPSIGHGWDYRYESTALTGSALVWGDHVAHMAFFKTKEEDKRN